MIPFGPQGPRMSPQRKAGVSKGVLNPRAARGKFDVARYEPGEDLARFVEHFWTVRWNLPPDVHHIQETLPYPAVHVVVEAGRSEIVGVITGRFTRVLEGHGEVFAAKFLPAGFQGFWGRPVSELTDRRLRLSRVFEVEDAALEARLFATDDDGERLLTLSEFLKRRLPPPDPEAQLASDVVALVAQDPAIKSAAELALRAGLGLRSLQRLFRHYVGVGPKWVIRRNRLQESAERLAAGAPFDQAALAAELGYADQAHFIRDFRELVGATPAAYAARNRGPSFTAGRRRSARPPARPHPRHPGSAR